MTHSLGYPRIGAKRELKKAVEGFWKGTIDEAALLKVGAELRSANWRTQRDAGIDLVPSNDFSFYDQVLDTSFLVGNVPARFRGGDGLKSYFATARGSEGACCGGGAQASELTKWFDTNYHYIVPEFDPATTFTLGWTKPFDEFSEALGQGIRTKPVLLGPLSYLYLGKGPEGFDRLDLLEKLIPVYLQVLERLRKLGAQWVQLDEPILALDLPVDWQAAFVTAYRALGAAAPGLKKILATYFGELRENLVLAVGLPVDVLHVDVTRAGGELERALRVIPSSLSLSLGIVDGRNIWKNDFEKSLSFINAAKRVLSPERILLAPSCSLLHSPVTLKNETKLDAEFRGWLAFAEEKLNEVSDLAKIASGKGDPVLGYKNRVAIQSRRASGRIHRAEVKERAAKVVAADLERVSEYAARRERQQAVLGLPLFPTTTIGSFPQTADVRAERARWRKGEIAEAEYETFLKQKTAECVRTQENIRLDVLVHGEFERTDMVEYFGEKLDGFAFTSNGWVQSYGSRCVKPPIIFGDVSRPAPMTVEWSTYAQSLTQRPMKGMLTGPVTILQWSFVRDDQPRSETARQIALVLRDEVLDLERAGIRIIQIDEPALREGLPLRRGDWPAYLDWSTAAFRLSAAGVRDETQIHTHMCYCEFQDILPSIAALDADVISIETSRSRMELLGSFAEFKYPNGIGPGVWDIHSPRVPSEEEMLELLRKAAAVIPLENLWANPDCGLKTRDWPEVTESLRHLVAAAGKLRAESPSFAGR